MIRRLGYAVLKSWQYRKELVSYCFDPIYQCDTVFDLDFKTLKQDGIQAVVLDFDGVLAPHGEDTLDQQTRVWLQSCLAAFGDERVFILTNRPGYRRWDTMVQAFPGIQFLKAQRKKPYPDGIEDLIEKTQLPRKAVVVIDDRLLTGILAAAQAQVRAFFLIKPKVALRKRPIQEGFFICLRWLDRLVVWLFKLLD